MKRLNSILFICFSFLISESQTIDPYHISFTGNSISNGNYTLDYSLGEILIETLSDSSFYCTQGLLQPNYNSLIGIEEITDKSVTVYPNPTSDKITIKSPLKIKTIIFNPLGEIVGKYNSEIISLFNFPKGIYYIKIYDFKNELVKTKTIIKI